MLVAPPLCFHQMLHYLHSFACFLLCFMGSVQRYALWFFHSYVSPVYRKQRHTGHRGHRGTCIRCIAAKLGASAWGLHHPEGPLGCAYWWQPQPLDRLRHNAGGGKASMQTGRAGEWEWDFASGTSTCGSSIPLPKGVSLCRQYSERSSRNVAEERTWLVRGRRDVASSTLGW